MRFYYHFQNVILEKTKPVVYYWPSARGWVRQNSSETQKTEKPTFTVFQALLTSITASFPHASPVGGLQHKLCFHQQILWVLLQKRATESTHFSPPPVPLWLRPRAPSPGCPGSWHQPSPCFHSLQSVLHHRAPFPPTSHLNSLGSCPPASPMVPQTDRHFLPQGLCTCSACYLESFPTRYPPGGSSPPTVHCQCFLIKKPSQTSPSSPALFFCIVLTHLMLHFTYLWSVPPTSKCRLHERQASVSFPSIPRTTHTL